MEKILDLARSSPLYAALLAPAVAVVAIVVGYPLITLALRYRDWLSDKFLALIDALVKADES